MVPAFDYQVHTEPHTLGGVDLQLTLLDDFEASAAAVHRALAPHISKEDNLDLTPMFGVIWASALPVCRLLGQRELRGCRMLELGCGLALPSLIAAKRGAKVVPTDMHPHTEAFLARNAEQNGVTLPYQRLDWRDPVDLGRFDLVIATDVLFARECPALVAGMFARTLKRGGTGFLTDPGRAYLDDFQGACEDLDLSVEIDIAPTGPGVDPGEVFLLTTRRLSR